MPRTADPPPTQDLPPTPPPPHPPADDERDYLRRRLRETTERLGTRIQDLADRVDRLTGETTVTGELDLTAAGLDPEQACRAAAAQTIGWQHPSDTDTSDYRDWWWAELDRLAAWIRDGSRP